jgi:membrane-associated phospholipid phosphatase
VDLSGAVRRNLMVAMVALGVLLPAVRAAAADAEAPSGAYRLSFELDVPLLLISGAVASSYLFIDETPPPTCAPLCNKNDVNAFDRPFAGVYSKTWSTVGNAATLVGVVAVPAAVLIGEPSRGGLADLLVVGEALLVTSAIQVPISYAVSRPRPRVYGEEAPLDTREEADAARSFFSGHVANCLAGTLVASTALRRTGHRSLALGVLIAGLAGSALVGVARVASGAHFPSDVLVGYAVGAGVGIAIPALHGAHVEISPTADAQSRGLAITGRF